MNCVLITQGLSPVVFPVLDQPHVKVSGITESAPRGYKPRLGRTGLRKMRALLPGGSLKAVARSRGIGYFLLHSRNLGEFESWLRDLKPDVVLIYSMSQLLPERCLVVPRLGVLNLHPSLLPAYRGPDPWFWTYYEAEPTAGVTLHYADRGEDTGDIIYQRGFQVPTGMSLDEMKERAIGVHGVELILRALRCLASGEPLPRCPQPVESPTQRARNVDAEDIRKLVNWESWSGKRIWHLMRGLGDRTGWLLPPQARSRFRRWEALEYVPADVPARAEPGAMDRDSQGWFLYTRDGLVRLKASLSIRQVLKRARGTETL